MTRIPDSTNGRTLFMLWLMVLFLFAAASPAQAIAKEAKESDLNQRFRGIEKKMETLYGEGKLEELIGLYVDNCRKQGKERETRGFKKVNKETRARIYRWVYLSYTALDMPLAADAVLERFLVIRYPEGVVETDWVFIKEAAKRKYLVAPRFLLGLRLGTNFTMMHPGQPYLVLVPVDPNDIKSYYKEYDFHLAHSRGTQFGLILEYALSKHLSITVQPAISSVKFQYKNTFTREREGQDDITLEFNHHHKLDYIEVPVLLTYRRLTGTFKPYVQLGAYYSILTGGEKSLHAVSLPDREYEEKAIVGIKRQFNTANIGLWLGAGLGYELSPAGLRLQVEVNYRFGLNNLVDEAHRFDNKELMFSYYDVFDDMKLRNWDLSVKLVLPLSYKAFRR